MRYSSTLPASVTCVLLFMLLGVTSHPAAQNNTPICDYSISQNTAQCSCSCDCPQPIKPTKYPIAEWMCIGGACPNLKPEQFDSIALALHQLQALGFITENDVTLTTTPRSELLENLRTTIEKYNIVVQPNLPYFFGSPTASYDYIGVSGAMLIETD